MKEREIIQSLVSQLTDLVEGEKCDHGAGICWCESIAALNYARAWINQEGFLGPRSVCECGHEGDGYPSDHGEGVGGGPGHGPCWVEGCSCKQFTFRGFTRDFVVYRALSNPKLVAGGVV